jgi:rubrerythrin
MSTDLDLTALSLMDALDLAILAEEEARERYVLFVDLLGHRYEGDATDVFRHMAVNEGKHEADLIAQRKALFGETPPNVDRSMLWEVEAPGQGEARAFMSPRRALDIALDAETKAHAFYTGALANVTDPQVKALFTELAAEEAEHVAAVRRLIALTGGDAAPELDDDDVDEPPAL